MFDIPLKVTIADTQRDIREMNRREPSDVGQIEKGRFVQQNGPVFRKSRIPVAAVKRYLDAGFAPKDIVQEFPMLTEDDVEAARNFTDKAAAA